MSIERESKTERKRMILILSTNSIYVCRFILSIRLKKNFVNVLMICMEGLELRTCHF
jgi:hypothetical protein